MGSKSVAVVRRRYATSAMVTTTLRVPMSLLRLVDSLVEEGYFASRADFFREAIRQLASQYARRDQYRPVPGYR